MSASLLESARTMLADLISLGQTRFELFSVELREELARLATLLIGGLAALVLGVLASPLPRSPSSSPWTCSTAC